MPIKKILICYGTRPEMIKLAPLINVLKCDTFEILTLFTNQHRDLSDDFFELVGEPDFIMEGVFEPNQSLNSLISKIIFKFDTIIDGVEDLDLVIVQGDTTTSLAIALATFYKKIKLAHVEAGLRTFDKFSPYPEEINRKLISSLSDLNFCPTDKSCINLINENIEKTKIFNVGNTIVDICEDFKRKSDEKTCDKNYVIAEFHRRENRGPKMESLWKQVINISKDIRIKYILHPPIASDLKKFFNQYDSCDLNNIEFLNPMGYKKIINLIVNSDGIISDSGGFQEEAVCLNKKILICRDVTERPESVDCGIGLLVDDNVEENIDFIYSPANKLNDCFGGYGVCERIKSVLISQN